MNNFFRRNQKKLLAVLGSFLMVVFILPSTCGRGGAGGREDVVVAYAGDEKIHASELAQSKIDWETLKRIPARAPRVAMQMGGSPYQPVPYPYLLGLGTAMEIDQSPELFLLLQKEAERNGIKVPPDRVDSALREANISPNVSPEEGERWRHAVESFLRVKGLYDRVTSNVKVSEPVVMQRLAQTAQEVQLNLVEFNADAAGSTTAPTTATTAPTTAPTPQELEAHFQKYANRPADLPSTNPAVLTFGYQRPNRVKVQYLTIGKAQVREAVRKSKEPYEWEVAARRYYLTHPTEFPVTQPASAPATTQSATNPATQRAASRPTTRPFEEVREQIMDRVTEPEVAKLGRQISETIAERMAADWEKQRPRTATTSTAPSTAATQHAATNPAASQPTGFAAFSYLEQLAADVQKQFGVLPAVTSKSDQWLSADELAKLPGIGTARRPASGQTFANYVLQAAEPLMPVPQRADAGDVLSLLEPSHPLEDADGNVYLFRLTDAQPAHAPQSLAEVRDQVEQDLRTARAYEKAVEEAKKLLEAAKKNGLAQAAAAAGRQVVATGTISHGFYGMGPTTIPNYPTSPESRMMLAGQGMLLLSEATPDAPHPVAVVPLPEDKKVVVAELGNITNRLPADQAYLTRIGVAHQMEFMQAQDLAAEWFTAPAVKARMPYRPLDEERKTTTDRTNDRTKTASAS